MKFSIISKSIKYICIYLGVSLFTSGAYADECSLPSGISLVTVGGTQYLKGDMVVDVGSGASKTIQMFVQNTPYSLNRCAATVYSREKSIFESLYATYLAKGMTTKNIQILADSISGIEKSGVFIRKDQGPCYYEGAPRRILCGAADSGASGEQTQKIFMSHENMHGWQFQFQTNVGGIHFYKAYAYFANLLYSAGSSLNGHDPETIPYGLQNQYEWGSEVFSDWLLGTTQGEVWPYIHENLPKYETYFNCLWTTDNTPNLCATNLQNPLQFAKVDPTQTPPNNVITIISAPGAAPTVTFSQTQSQAIWNVCFNPYTNLAVPADYTVLNQIIQRVAPNLPTGAASHYKLMYADANNDNVFDWLCEYAGPGPTGVGNGQYLWNKDNRYGTYTFIVSGKGAGDYVQYKQDPYSTLPSMQSGALAQPQFREWQGKFGSANGASQFDYHYGFSWYPYFASTITPGTISVSTQHGTKCLGVLGTAAANVSTTLTECDIAPKWQRLYNGDIGLVGSDPTPTFCLDVDTASSHPHNVQIWNCGGTPTNQIWDWNGDGLMKLKSKGLCLSTTETNSGQLTIAGCGLPWKLNNMP